MFSSTILDVAAGLLFVFFTVSLAAGAIVEALSGFLQKRHDTLLQGIKDLMNDSAFNALAAQLYQHALVNPRNSGSGTSATALNQNKPAYIDPKHFAEALIDILNTGNPTVQAPGTAAAGARTAAAVGPMTSGDMTSINAAIDHVVPVATNPQINDLLKGVARRTNGNLNRMRDEIAGWFDSAMDRLSGVYKRWSQLVSFFIALALAVAMNASAIHVAKVLWAQPASAKVLETVSKDQPDLQASLAKLQQVSPLPLWWSHYCEDTAKLNGGGFALYWLELVLGWIITAAATLFGAPFWFDLLQKVVRLKSAGPSPREKREGSAASA
jgi:hypothetical protein